MKLSICLPVYNNISLFKYSLKSAINSVKGNEDIVEIVVSDNCSEDDIKSIVSDMILENKQIKLIYSRNPINQGLAYNFHKVVELASGEYCWIIGSDDFIHKESIQKLIDVITENTDINFISVSYNHLNLEMVHDSNNKNDPYHNILNYINLNDSLSNNVKFLSEQKIIWDKLVDPSFKNVMLGSVMSGIFKKSVWDSVDNTQLDKSMDFNNLQNVYPHLYIYANSMVGKTAYYVNMPLITVGDGARNWAGNEFWDGSLPIIYLKIYREIIEAYQYGGLNKKQLIKCKLSVSHTVGRLLFPFIKRKYILKKSIKSGEFIIISKIIKDHFLVPTFYVGFLKGLIKNNI